MQKSQVDPITLVAAALAATLALTLLLGPFAWMASIVGLILLMILFGFDQEGYRTVFGSLAYSAVCGLCFSLACGIFLKYLAEQGEVHLSNDRWVTAWLPLTFAFATAILWAIDRSRMSGRLSAAERLVSRPTTIQRSFLRDIPPAAAPAPPPPVSPAAPAADVVRSETVPTPQPEPQRSYSQEPLPQQALYTEAPPIQDPMLVRSARPQSLLTPKPSEVVRPAPEPIVPRGGKETAIYVALMGEGLNVMRSVKAEHLGRDYYRINDTMPEGETWQFQPGQVVRCKKQTLSTGKSLVAFEEAPRAR